MIARLSLLACLLLLTGCMQIRTELQPKNADVKPAMEGRDCVGIFVGLAFGTNTAEEAMRHAFEGDSESYYVARIPSTITRIHSIALLDTYTFIAGERCIIVTGE